MQCIMPTDPPPTLLNPLDDAEGVAAVDYSADFDSLYKRMENIEKLYKYGRAPGNLIRYIPRLAKPVYQGQITRTIEKKPTPKIRIEIKRSLYLRFSWLLIHI